MGVSPNKTNKPLTSILSPMETLIVPVFPLQNACRFVGNIPLSAEGIGGRHRSAQRADKCCFPVTLQNFAISSILKISARYSRTLRHTQRHMTTTWVCHAPFKSSNAVIDKNCKKNCIKSFIKV